MIGDGSAHESPGDNGPGAEPSRSRGPGERLSSTGGGSATGALAELRASDPQVRYDVAHLVWRLEGYTNAEIGRMIRRTEPTVELKMRLIRETLGRDPGVSPELASRLDDAR